MKNDLAYWEKSKEHLQKHFLDWEEFVWAEKINKKELIYQFFIASFTFVMAIFMFTVACFTSLLFSLIMAGVCLYLSAEFLKKYSQGAFLPHWLILTTRGIYYCCGEECQIAYQWSFSEMQELVRCQSVFKKRECLEIYPQKPFKRFLSLFTKSESLFRFLRNQKRIRQGKDFTRSMRSLSSYIGGIRVRNDKHSPDCINICFDKGTEIFAPLEGILYAYPHLSYACEKGRKGENDEK
jgi:hypothetical protein